jgi:hypothetical protein
MRRPLAQETQDAITVQLISFDLRPLTQQEHAIIKLIREWFPIDCSLPDPEDIADHLDLASEQMAKNHLQDIREKTGLKHSYQIPFLRCSQEMTLTIPLLRTRPRPLENHRGGFASSSWTDQEREVILFFKKRFFESLSIPSWEEVAKYFQLSSGRYARHYLLQIGGKTSANHAYQIPFVQLDEPSPSS